MTDTRVLFFTRQQAGEVTNTSEDFIRTQINAGKLRAKRLGDAKNAPYLISREALEEWFADLPDA